MQNKVCSCLIIAGDKMLRRIANKVLKKKPVAVPTGLIFDYCGYENSVKYKRPVNESMEPIPWFTYPALEFISQFDLNEKCMLEFGSGHSTLFFSQRVKEITSVETDSEWHKEIKAKNTTSNLNYILTNQDDFVKTINSINGQYDIIVIDHIFRGDCAKYSLNHLNSGGMIIFDNSDWFKDDCKILRNAGFIQIDFHGYGPINPYSWTTSIFFKGTLNLKPFSDIQPAKSFKGIVH